MPAHRSSNLRRYLTLAMAVGALLAACTPQPSGPTEPTSTTTASSTTTVPGPAASISLTIPLPGSELDSSFAAAVDVESPPPGGWIRYSLAGSVVFQEAAGVTTTVLDGGTTTGPAELLVELLDDHNNVVASDSTGVLLLGTPVPSLDDLHAAFERAELSPDQLLLRGAAAIMAMDQAEDHIGELTPIVLSLAAAAYSSALPEAQRAFAALSGGTELGGTVDQRRPAARAADDPDCPLLQGLTWGFGLIWNDDFCSYLVQPGDLADRLPDSVDPADLVSLRFLVDPRLDDTDLDSDGIDDAVLTGDDTPDVVERAAIKLWKAQAVWSEMGFVLPQEHRGGTPVTIVVTNNNLAGYSSPFAVTRPGTNLGHMIRVSGPKGHLASIVVHEFFHTHEWSWINWNADIGLGDDGRGVTFYESAANWGREQYAARYEPSLDGDFTQAVDEWLSQPARAFLTRAAKATPGAQAYGWFTALEWLDEHGGADEFDTSGLIRDTLRSYTDHSFGAEPIDLISDQLDRGAYATDDTYRTSLAWPRMWTALYLLRDGATQADVFAEPEWRWSMFWNHPLERLSDELDRSPATKRDEFGKARPARITDSPVALTLNDGTWSTEVEIDRGGAAFVDVTTPAEKRGTVEVELVPDDDGDAPKVGGLAISYNRTGHPEVCVRDDRPELHVSDGTHNDDGSIVFEVPFDPDCPTMTVGLVHAEPASEDPLAATISLRLTSVQGAPYEDSRDHTCVAAGIALQNAKAWCWGANSYGQVDPGTQTDVVLQPELVDGLTLPRGPAPGGGHTCAFDYSEVIDLGPDGVSVTYNPRFSCWGRNDHGQLGSGTTTDQFRAVQVALPAAPVRVTTGMTHTCAIAKVGAEPDSLWCWGSNRYGELGDGTTVQRTSPVRVPGTDGVTRVSAGDGYTCAVIDGTTSCWGRNDHGELGLGTIDSLPHPSPQPVALAGLTGVAAGRGTTCAIGIDARAYCWGRNHRGQVGNGTLTDTATPDRVELPAGVTTRQITVGGGHACATTAVGDAPTVVYCWGRNDSSQTGLDLSESEPPHPVPSVDGAAQVVAYDRHTCVVLTTLRCFGDNSRGQLGNGTTVTTKEPQTVAIPG